jgi:dihydroxyacetone kinase
MAGASLSILHLDDELAELIDAPARSPFFTQGAVAPAAQGTTAQGAPAQGTTAQGTTAQAATARPLASGRSASATGEVRRTSEPGRLREVVVAVTGRLPRYSDELRELDAALGDGDLGITVGAGAKAVHDAVAALPNDAHPSEVLRAAGVAFSGANPSTYAALVGGGLVAASQALTDVDTLDAAALTRATRSLLERIQERGGAEVGDKTVVDVIAPVLAELERSDGRTPAEVARASVDAAASAVDEGAGRTSRRGRASWVGERSAGHRDPGSVAFLHLLEEIADEL